MSSKASPLNWKRTPIEMSDTDLKSSSGGIGRIASTLKSRFRLIWLAPVLAVIALGAWVFASPIGSSPDDDFHLASIWCANDLRTDLCEAGPTDAERVVPPAVLQAPCFAYDNTKTATAGTCSMSRSGDLGGGCGLWNYPPVYYAFMNTFAARPAGISAPDEFVNVLLLVGLTIALYCLLPHARHQADPEMAGRSCHSASSSSRPTVELMGCHRRGHLWLALISYSDIRATADSVSASFSVSCADGGRCRKPTRRSTIIGSLVAMILTVSGGESRWCSPFRSCSRASSRSS